jgi:hypothetical protein
MKKFAGLTSAAGLVFTVACGQTDAGITTAVKSKLAVDDTVKAYQVDVDTQNKIVTLRGEVDSTVAETMALQLARDTDGVRDVIDEIRVVQVAPTSGIDPDIDIDIDVDDDDRIGERSRDAGNTVVDGAKKGADVVVDGAKKGADAVADGAKKGARAVADGAKKVGGAVRDAVTDDDPDSDRDGK